MAKKTTTKYKMLRLPSDVWETWFNRKKRIQERIKITLNKNKRVNMTDVLRYYGNRKIDIWDDELINYFYKKQKKRKFMDNLI